jgi:tRNA(Ile2) C34 agmatinyltransferase TiaS
MTAANRKCPHDCGGHLKQTKDPNEYKCSRCGRILRQSVVKRIESFERVAKSDAPAAEIAQAALEGVTSNE